jgi:glycosyltransferase involved in cell wall biosynthesis
MDPKAGPAGAGEGGEAGSRQDDSTQGGAPGRRDDPSRRLLVLSYNCPPQAGGASRVLQNLFHWFERDDVVIVGARPLGSRGGLTERPDHPTYRVPSYPLNGRGERFLRFLSLPFFVLVALWCVVIHRRRVLFVVFPEESVLLAGYLVHLLTRLPLAVYFHDLYRENRTGFPFGTLARWLEPRVMRRARVFFSLHPAMAKHYEKTRDLRKQVILRHCLNLSLPDRVEPRELSGSMRIGFSGNIYGNVLDCLRTMTGVLSEDTGLDFVYFTPASEESLRQFGVLGRNMTRRFASSSEELRRGLEECDVLYLPLCFDCPGLDPLEIATAFPTKTLEYLASGRPVLVHCPGHYQIAEFFREHDAGLVVDRPDAQSLRAGLGRLRDDALLRARLVGNAVDAARLFEGSHIADVLRDALREACAQRRPGPV